MAVEGTPEEIDQWLRQHSSFTLARCRLHDGLPALSRNGRTAPRAVSSCGASRTLPAGALRYIAEHAPAGRPLDDVQQHMGDERDHDRRRDGELRLRRQTRVFRARTRTSSAPGRVYLIDEPVATVMLGAAPTASSGQIPAARPLKGAYPLHPTDQRACLRTFRSGRQHRPSPLASIVGSGEGALGSAPGGVGPSRTRTPGRASARRPRQNPSFTGKRSPAAGPPRELGGMTGFGAGSASLPGLGGRTPPQRPPPTPLLDSTRCRVAEHRERSTKLEAPQSCPSDSGEPRPATSGARPMGPSPRAQGHRRQRDRRQAHIPWPGAQGRLPAPPAAARRAAQGPCCGQNQRSPGSALGLARVNDRAGPVWRRGAPPPGPRRPGRAPRSAPGWWPQLLGSWSTRGPRPAPR